MSSILRGEYIEGLLCVAWSAYSLVHLIWPIHRPIQCESVFPSSKNLDIILWVIKLTDVLSVKGIKRSFFLNVVSAKLHLAVFITLTSAFPAFLILFLLELTFSIKFEFFFTSWSLRTSGEITLIQITAHLKTGIHLWRIALILAHPTKCFKSTSVECLAFVCHSFLTVHQSFLQLFLKFTSA